MADERRGGKFYRHFSNEDDSNFNSRRGRPGIAIYRPGSGPLLKTGGNKDDFPGELLSKNDRPQLNDIPKDKHNINSRNASIDKCDIKRNSDDNDRMSISSSSSNRDRKIHNRPNSNTSSNDSRRRSKKPEVALYVPKPLLCSINERNNKCKEIGEPSRKYRGKKWPNDEQSWDSDQYDEEQPLNSLNTETESKYKNDFKRKKTKQKSTRNENVSNLVTSNGNPTPLMDIKFDSTDFEKLRISAKNEHFEKNIKPVHVENPIGRVNESTQLENRKFRQTSEPRSLPLTLVDNRSRDSRSMEPVVGVNAKPPLGQYSRRGGKQVTKLLNPISIDSIPPRFRKKYLEDNGYQESPLPQTSYIGTNSEDIWDGSSITFQGANANMYYPTMHPPPVFNQPLPHMIYSQPPPPVWSQTLPPRSRGRGRLGPRELEMELILHKAAVHARSLTPDCFKEVDSRSLDSMPVSRDNSRPSSRNERYGTYKHPFKDDLEKYMNRSHSMRDKKEESFYEDDSSESYSNKHEKNIKQDEDTDKHRSQRNKKSENTSYENNCAGYSTNNQNWKNAQKSYKEEKKCDDKNGLNTVSKGVTSKSPEQPKSPKDLVSKSTPDILDWAEEVELSEQLNNKSKNVEEPCSKFNSDLPRTTSLNSLQGNPRHNRSKGRRQRRKRKPGKENSDRSLSREHIKHNDDRWRGSRDQNSQHSRNSSAERRNWREPSTDSMVDSNIPWRSQCQSSSRNSSMERWNSNMQHNDKHNSSDRRYSRDRSRRNSSNDRLSYRNGSTERQGYRNHNQDRRGSRNLSNERQKDSKKIKENWRTETSRLSHQQQEIKEPQKPAGILVLPAAPQPSVSPNMEQAHFQRHLFDPSNPNKPIIVPASGTRSAPYPMHDYSHPSPDQFAVPRAPNHHSHNPKLLMDMEQAEYEMSCILGIGRVFEYWPRITELRKLLENILRALLTTDIKFCEQANIEQHFWKLLYYNIIEYLRKGMTDHPEAKEQYKILIIGIVEEGMKYLEQTLEILGQVYKFKLDDFLHPASTPMKGKSYVTLALISCQKLLLFLGDLSRYKEQANDSTNYGLARQWYIKAHQLNPKNGRPYNQLAVLALYARRKLDAVYYYMRSLMASIPVMSSRESLLSLFDENRKKYELTEKKRRMEREAKEKERMKEKETGSNSGRLRREVWIHPGGGKRVHRTTSTAQSYDNHSEDELSTISNLEVNKRFGMSFLHVQGKLFTKIGMESFQEAAIQMLREFRALLQHSPIPLNSNRLLQLLALNMFAIDNTQLKNDQLESGYRSAVQECALVVSLQMFNLIVERCVQLLKEQTSEPQQSGRLIVNADVQVLLPAIKVWCDWLLCHSCVWNPPPSCRDYRVGQPGDAWSRLATLVNALEKLYHNQDILSATQLEGYELVRLPEDATLGGFLPLMSNAQEPTYASKDTDVELTHVCLRICKILFFGSVFLCGVDPPVLKLHKNESGQSEYVSVVEIPSPPIQSDAEVCVESFSDSAEDSEDSSQTLGTEDSCSNTQMGSAVEPEIQSLLHRKEQLEKSHRRQERRQQQVQSILQQNLVSVEMEVKPHYLVADTNCFIDYLPQLTKIAQASSAQKHLYTLMVPLVVLNELDGLTRGQRDGSSRPEHAVMVSEAAKKALDFLRCRGNFHPPLSIRCVTTKGTILNSTTFTMEEDGDEDMKNDDRILATCLNLCAKSHSSVNKNENAIEGEPRKIFRDVVLLTEDRNLRVKALARDMPVREVPNFIQWAGLGVGMG